MFYADAIIGYYDGVQRGEAGDVDGSVATNGKRDIKLDGEGHSSDEREEQEVKR